MSELRVISKIMEQYKEDPKAWENVCDWLETALQITDAQIEMCQTAEAYLRNIYPAAKRAADVVHVMSTVPVFVLVNAQDGQKEQFISFTSDDPEAPTYVPVFFAKDQALEAMKDIENPNAKLECLTLPFFLLVDSDYGVFANSIPPVIMALCDCRPGKPWMYFNMHQIPSLVLDATAALRSNFQADVIQMTAAQIMPAGILDARNREEDWTSDGDGVRHPPFGGKLPVS
ncbi:hypothetical protein [Candidatus Allofournierella merdipullorum]|uniref:hypothetical protein n=1 Tax=Candidatus Allofournierella merdipullorum TaxID=2838595 RepID=UPI00374F47E6